MTERNWLYTVITTHCITHDAKFLTSLLNILLFHFAEQYYLNVKRKTVGSRALMFDYYQKKAMITSSSIVSNLSIEILPLRLLFIDKYLHVVTIKSLA